MVIVETPVSGVAITCPPEIATYELASCTIEVMSGTGMEVVISYNDGTTSVSKSFTIAGIVKSLFNDMFRVLRNGLCYK